MKKKKLLSILTALAMTSSLATPAFATATSSVTTQTTVELVAAASGIENVVNATQGETVNFNIQLSIPDGTDLSSTVAVDTNYHLSKEKPPTSSLASDTITFNKSSNNTVTISATVTVDKDVSAGKISVPINVTILNNSNGKNMAAIINNAIDNFIVNVLPADTIAPVVTISSPIDNGYYNASTLPKSPVYSVVEASEHTETVTGWDDSEGTHTVTVTSKDAFGNVGSASIDYIVDTLKPTISTKIVDGGIYNETTLKNIGEYYSIQDANPFTESASQLDYTEGNHTTIINATDKAGNSESKTINYIVDNTAPIITFNFDDAGFYKSTFTGFTPYYNVQDAHLDNTSANAPDLNLEEGNHSVTVSASDLAGNSNSASASYTVDDTVPEVTINLDSTKFYNKKSLDLLGDYYTAKDTNLLNVSASHLETIIDGTYTATVTATDRAGNETTQTVSYSVDNTSPVITFNGKLKNGGFYQSSALASIAESFFTATDAHLVSATASSKTLDLTDGQHILSVTALDAAGNETIESITYTIDNTAPVVEFNITDRDILTTTNLNKILDGKDYYIASDNISVVSVVADQLQTFEGTYTLNVTVKDAAGNETKKNITYTIDNTAPIITAPTSITAEATGKLTVVNLGSATATDLVSFGEDLIVTNNAPESFPVGTTTVTWTATDKAGNSNTATQTVKVQDTTAPIFTFVPKDIVTTISGTSTKLAIGTATANDIFDVTLTNDAPDTFPVGTTIVTWTAEDPSGNIANTTQKVTVYQFSGVLQPVNAVTTDQDISIAKISQYKIGSTIPVKFTLTGNNGFVNPLTAALSIKKSSSALPIGAELETAVSTSAATTDNLFRYDSTSGQYIFNLSSKGFTSGTYVIRIALSNGQSYDYFISFK